jgi:hypothetical protein
VKIEYTSWYSYDMNVVDSSASRGQVKLPRGCNFTATRESLWQLVDPSGVLADGVTTQGVIDKADVTRLDLRAVGEGHEAAYVCRRSMAARDAH